MIVLIMGVSGAGKSTVGQLLASEMGWPFYDSDQFHPPENIQKMSLGLPLNDEDRLPWLNAIRARKGVSTTHTGLKSSARQVWLVEESKRNSLTDLIAEVSQQHPTEPNPRQFCRLLRDIC